MDIYYGTSVRGINLDKQRVKNHIKILQKYGNVLTKHLALDNPDVGKKSDEEIANHDNMLVRQCDIYVGDITTPSAGSSIIMERCRNLLKPVLGLCYKPTDETPKLSAMYAFEGFTIMFYKDDNEFRKCIKTFMVNNYDKIKHKYEFIRFKIILSALPGCGKSTVAVKLEEEYDIVNISTGQMLRELTKNTYNPLGQKVNQYISTGQLVPADIMCDIVINRLNQPDCLLFGFCLDGYPPSIEDLKNLQQHDIIPHFIFCLECSDATAISRQCDRGARETDNIETATERVKIYHGKIPDFVNHSLEWFPSVPVVRINAENTAEQVWKDVHMTIDNFNSLPLFSYFPFQPFEQKDIKSTKFHFHVDGENHESIQMAAIIIQAEYQQAQGQIKIYPIDYLHIGPQFEKFKAYDKMMNFHEISENKYEAFITGRLGNEYNADFMKAVLYVAKASQNIFKYMVEMEEYIGEWHLHAGKVVVETHYVPTQINMDNIAEYKSAKLPNPPLELHLGFNMKKLEFGEDKPIIDLEKLMIKCKEKGFDNGGWFIFKHITDWCYRSNEFSYENIETAQKKLFEQAIHLDQIIKEEFGYSNIDINFSLEIIHGIWQF